MAITCSVVQYGTKADNCIAHFFSSIIPVISGCMFKEHGFLIIFDFRVRPLSDGSSPWSTLLMKNQKGVPLASLFMDQGEYIQLIKGLLFFFFRSSRD